MVARLRLAQFGGLLVVAAGLVLIGHFFVIQREPSAAPGSYRNMSSDAVKYVCMVEKDFTCANTPFRYRVLVPILARLLPLSAPEALRLITYFSLFLTYYTVLLIGLKIGLNRWGALVGLLLIFTSNVHLYNYNNPFLLDAFQQLALTWMLWGILFDSFALYTASALVGVLCREVPLAMAGAWAVLRGWRRGFLVWGLLAIIFVIPRFVLPGAGAQALVESFTAPLAWTFASRSPLLIPIHVAWAWGFIWFPALLGWWLLPRERFALFTGWLTLSLLTLLAVMFFAEDTSREVAILTPVFIITVGQLCTTLLETGHRRWVWLLVALSALQFFVALPNVVLNETVWDVARWGKAGLLVAGTVYSAGILLILRAELKQAMRARAGELSCFLRARFHFQAVQPVQGS